MLNVPNATAQARLVGVMSDVYTGHFTLAAEQRDPRKAYEILERARGRALADVLRGSNQEESGDPQRQQAISHLQVRLMRALSEAERRSILDALWEAEDVVWRTRVSLRPATLERPAGVELAIVQQQLAPSETLLEYVLSEPRSYCLIITRTGIDLVLLPSAGEINSTAETFVSGIRKQSVGIAGRLLYEAVLRPVLSRTPGRQFIIVPDGQLHRVPFDAFSRSTKA
jgi:hypothetical protein